MGRLRTLLRPGRGDGASRRRHLGRAGQSFTYLNVTAREGAVRPDGMLVVGFHGLGACKAQMETLVPIDRCSAARCAPSGSSTLDTRSVCHAPDLDARVV